MYSQLVHRAGLREVITAIIILLSLDLPLPLKNGRHTVPKRAEGSLHNVITTRLHGWFKEGYHCHHYFAVDGPPPTA